MSASSFTQTLLLAFLTGSALAQTSLNEGGDLNDAFAWSNGLPAFENEGTIDVIIATNSQTVFGYGADAVTNLVAGTITADDAFNLLGAGTWNISGGKIITRYFLANGQTGPTIVNMSGGEIELKADSSNFISVGNGGVLNISGSAVLNAATGAGQNMSTPNGDIDIAPDWTGQWSVDSFIGDDWRTLFINNPSMKLDGETVDGVTFESSFLVTDGGQTLSLAPPPPNSEFQGGDLLVAGNWDNGLPLDPPVGTVAVNGTLDSANAVTDWKFEVSDGALTATQDWHFSGSSQVTMSGGSLAVTGDLLTSGDTLMVFRGGSVTWGETFQPSGGTINIQGGAFTGTSDESTSLGNTAGGTLAISGGTITASRIDFGQGLNTTLSRGAELTANNATFGVLDINGSWTGTFTVTGFSGNDWREEFTSDRITLAGETLDAATFANRFEVSEDGRTLRYNPATSFEGGDLLFIDSWSNGLPAPGVPASVTMDGFNSETVFGFGGTVIEHRDGTIASLDGFNFIQGDTWNMSGGRLEARYVLANGQNAPDTTTINLSGGVVFLTDVEGNQHMGAANGGTFNVSGDAVLDGTHATLEIQTGGTVNISSDWTGQWIWGYYTGEDWQNLFLNGLITYDDEILDLDGFNANFAVSADGSTLRSLKGGAPVITDLDYNSDGTVTLTWKSRPDVSAGYTLLFNADLSSTVSSWPDENDSITTGGEVTTYTTQRTFSGPRHFFVVVENP